MATSGGGHTQEANVFVTFNHSTHPAYSFRPATDFFQLAHVVYRNYFHFL
jgi:hypothetical protein